MKKFGVFFVLILVCLSLYAQDNFLSEKEVETLKKQESDLWYVDDPSPKYDKIVDSSKIQSEKINGRIRENQGLDKFWTDSMVSFFKWTFILIFLAGLIYVFWKSDFKYKVKSLKNQELNEPITETTTIENIEQLNTISFENQIATAENNQNYRLALRLYYLWLLKKLTEKELVFFHIKKTNQDYCNELKNTEWSGDFELCTYHYNYVWFGKFALNEAQYLAIISNFKNLIQKLK